MKTTVVEDHSERIGTVTVEGYSDTLKIFIIDYYLSRAKTDIVGNLEEIVNWSVVLDLIKIMEDDKDIYFASTVKSAPVVE